MTQLNAKPVGRPQRASIEVARTSAWYQSVRGRTGWTETKLETFFTEDGRAVKRRHRPTRWNKYRFGRTSPPRGLLERVEEVVPGTLAVYDHVVWTLADLSSPTPDRLRLLAAHLKPAWAALILDSKATLRHTFWQRQDFDHRAMVTATAQWKTLPRRTRCDAVAALLWSAHDAVLRQDERQHFECYVAIAHGARVQYARAPGRDVSAWRLEAHLFADWLKTDYRTPQYSETVIQLRRVTTGPRAPWLKLQPTLALSSASRLAQLKDAREQQGFWTAYQLPEWHQARMLKYKPR